MILWLRTSLDISILLFYNLFNTSHPMIPHILNTPKQSVRTDVSECVCDGMKKIDFQDTLPFHSHTTAAVADDMIKLCAKLTSEWNERRNPWKHRIFISFSKGYSSTCINCDGMCNLVLHRRCPCGCRCMWNSSFPFVLQSVRSITGRMCKGLVA